MFYVYRLKDEYGRVLYIGKGSGRRLYNQKRKYRCEGEIVREFAKEADAYKYEIECIATERPELNIHKGGNGSWVRRPKRRKTKIEREIERVGSRVYVARFLVDRCFYRLKPDQLERLKKVAYPQELSAASNAI